MKTRIWVTGAVATLAIWYFAGVSAVLGQPTPSPTPAGGAAAVATAAATAPAAPSPPAAPLPSAGSAKPEGSTGVSVGVGVTVEDDLDDLPPDVRARLSPEQLFQLLHERQKRHGDTPAVAIVVPVSFFLVTFFVVAAALYAGFRRDRQRHETLRLALERGAQIPVELLTPPKKPGSDLRRGILLTAAGLALGVLLLSTTSERGVWTASLIPTLLGIGYLVVHKLEGGGGQMRGVDAPPSYRAPGG